MNETSARIRIALLGAGAWGLNHLRVLLAEPRCEVVAVVDPTIGARERARTQGAAHTYEDAHTSVFEDPTIDAVVIATPGPTHAPLARAALAANKHVLVEKPFAMSTDDARRVAETAARHDRTIMVGHLMLFHPAVLRLKQLVDSGVLGSVHYGYAIRANMGRIRHDENALWSFAPHELSILEFLFERSPASVAARGQCIVQPGVHDVVFLTLQYADGKTVQLHASRLHPRKERRFTLICSGKMVEFDDVASDKLRIYDKAYDAPPAFTEFAEYLTLGDGDIFIPKLPIEEPLRLQLRHFIDSIVTSSTPRADVRSALRVTAILEAAQRSLDLDGVPVEIPSTIS